jgi:hypothetical protein
MEESTMKLAMLRRAMTTTEDATSGPSLMILGRSAEILPWPGEPATQPEPAFAEVRTKIFTGQQVEQDTYSATVNAAGRSVAAILSALADACASVEDFGRALGSDDHLILNIQVRI